MIKIKTQDFIIHGSGNLIVVNGKFYISTCLHVLYDDYTSNITIIFNDKRVMTIGREILIFDTLDIDLALIEAFPTSTQQKYALKVSDQYLFIGDSLIGVRFRKKYASIVDCKIIEMPINATKQGDYQYRINCVPLDLVLQALDI